MGEGAIYRRTFAPAGIETRESHFQRSGIRALPEKCYAVFGQKARSTKESRAVSDSNEAGTAIVHRSKRRLQPEFGKIDA